METGFSPSQSDLKNEMYKTTINPRAEEFELEKGLVLVIANNYYRTSYERKGNEVDVSLIQNLARLLKFDIKILQDNNKPHQPLTKENVEGFLNTVATDNETLRGLDCLLIFILFHGNEDKGREFIFFNDTEKMYLSDIVEKFSNTSCIPLCGKPKLFFIEACRGIIKANAVTLLREIPPSSDGGSCEIVTVADMTELFIAYASYDGTKAYLTDFGSLFIRSMQPVFEEGIITGKELHEMMIEVNRNISRLYKRYKEGTIDIQVACFKSSLTKKVFFREKIVNKNRK